MVHNHFKETLINKHGYGCIYCITNRINGMQYIGQTSKEYISARWADHKNSAKNHRGNMILYDAIREYGVENFIFEVVLEDVPLSKLWDKEIEYIAKYNTLYPNGYNSTKGGGGTLGFEPWDKGIKRSAEDISKIKRSYTEERKLYMSSIMQGENNPMYGRTGALNPFYGKGLCGETNGFYGKHHTDETKKKLSDLKDKQKKKVIMIDKDTQESIKVFESLSSASAFLRENTKFTKADDSAIGKCARNKSKIAYGYKWQFVEEEHGIG